MEAPLESNVLILAECKSSLPSIREINLEEEDRASPSSTLDDFFL